MNKNAVNISGILVQAWPDKLTAVKNRLEEIPGVEVHAESENGHLVTTIETTDVQATTKIMTDLQYVEGVLSATLVYHHEEQQPEKLEVSCETH